MKGKQVHINDNDDIGKKGKKKEWRNWSRRRKRIIAKA